MKNSNDHKFKEVYLELIENRQNLDAPSFKFIILSKIT